MEKPKALDNAHTSKFTKRIIILVLVIILLIIAILAIADTYSKYYARAWAVQKQDVGKWQVKLNNLDIYSKNGDAVTFEMDTANSSNNTSQGKIAPGVTVYSDITLDPTGTDVAVRYDITLDTTSIDDNGIEFDVELQNAEDEATSKKLIQTDINTYTGVLNLDEIKNGLQEVIRVTAKWENNETNNEKDSQKGLTYGTNFQIPVKVACIQYLGEEITEDMLLVATNADKYGDEVIGYECSDPEAQKEAGAWRLFYQNKNYTYLQSDNVIILEDSLENLALGKGYEHSTLADISTVGKMLNAKYFSSLNTLNESFMSTSSVKYMTEPTIWSRFRNEDSLFAIGGVTYDLYVRSFNAKALTDGRDLMPFANTSILGYIADDEVEKYRIPEKIAHEIYFVPESAVWAWRFICFSSPSDYYGQYDNLVGLLARPVDVIDSLFFDCNVHDTGSGFGWMCRPLVCMETSVFKEKYEATLESNYIGEAINADKYGQKVKGYTSQDPEVQKEVGSWRLFYQNKDYTYLISDNTIDKGDSIQSLYTKAGYENKTGADVSKIGQVLNPMLKNAGGFTSNNTYRNIKAVGYLTDPTQWEKYKGTDAIFAIGSPTIELFAESFNAAGNKAGDGRPIISLTTETSTRI